MKNNCGKMIELHFSNQEDFGIGIINCENNKYVSLSMIDNYGSYDGQLCIEKNCFDKMIFKSNYLAFIKKIMYENEQFIVLKNKMDFIKYAFDNERLLSISCKKWKNIRIMKLLELKDNVLVCRFINQIGELKKIYTININDIDQLEFDTKELKTYERLLNYNKK